MTGAERMLVALQGGRPDRTPVMPKIWLDSAAMLSGTDLADAAGRPHSATRLIVEVAHQFDFDGARMHLFPSRRLQKGDGVVWELDASGRCIGAVDLSGGLGTEPQPPADFDWSDPETLFALQYRPTLLDEEAEFDWSTVAVPDAAFYEQRYGTVIRGLLRDFGGAMACVGDCDTASLPFFARFRGVQGVMTDLLLRPDFARASFQIGIEFVVQRAKFFIDCGCRVLRVNDSMANMNLISPEQWREFVGPVFKEVCRRIRAYRPDVLIYCHVCGNVMPVIADLRRTGLDCIGPMDPLGGVDVGRVREIVGAGYCLMGGVNTLTLAQSAAKDVAAECENVLKGVRADEGAFILGSGCALSRLTPPANLRVLREAVERT